MVLPKVRTQREGPPQQTLASRASPMPNCWAKVPGHPGRKCQPERVGPPLAPAVRLGGGSVGGGAARHNHSYVAGRGCCLRAAAVRQHNGAYSRADVLTPTQHPTYRLAMGQRLAPGSGSRSGRRPPSVPTLIFLVRTCAAHMHAPCVFTPARVHCLHTKACAVEHAFTSGMMRAIHHRPVPRRHGFAPVGDTLNSCTTLTTRRLHRCSAATTLHGSPAADGPCLISTAGAGTLLEDLS